jgi:hypothetical protein
MKTAAESAAASLPTPQRNHKKGGDARMTVSQEILRALGRIEGELIEIRKLSTRVSRVEVWQSWLRGAWAALAAWVWLTWRAFAK